jgi:hypothetical protein
MQFSALPKRWYQKPFRFHSVSGQGKPPRRRATLLQVDELEERAVPTGTWTPLTNPAPAVVNAPWPDEVGTMLLLPNGTVMAQDYGNGTTWTGAWFELTPNSSGSYDKAPGPFWLR